MTDNLPLKSEPRSTVSKECWDYGGWTIRLDLSSAAAAESLQLCPTLCDPIDRSPPGSPVPGILDHIKMGIKE